jgi:hypothetical protein
MRTLESRTRTCPKTGGGGLTWEPALQSCAEGARKWGSGTAASRARRGPAPGEERETTASAAKTTDAGGRAEASEPWSSRGAGGSCGGVRREGRARRWGGGTGGLSCTRRDRPSAPNFVRCYIQLQNTCSEQKWGRGRSFVMRRGGEALGRRGNTEKTRTRMGRWGARRAIARPKLCKAAPVGLGPQMTLTDTNSADGFMTSTPPLWDVRYTVCRREPGGSYARVVLFFHGEKASRVPQPQRVTRDPLRTLDRWKASQCHPPSFLR